MTRQPAQTKPSAVAEGAAKLAPVKRIRKAVAVANDPLPLSEPVARRKPSARKAMAVANEALQPSDPASQRKPGAPTARKAKLVPAGVLPPARIPPEALVAPRNDKLVAWMFGISFAVHAVLLSIHFAPAVVKDLYRASPLEVALVNAKTKERPVKADVLAQANLDGGGNTDLDRRAKSPLPVLPKDSAQNEITLATQKLDDLERQAREMLTNLRAAQALAVAPRAPSLAEPPELPTSNEMMQRTLEAMRLEAQIAKDMDAYQKRPKRKFVGARAEEYRFARYVEDWRLKVERVGNLNYPEAARAKKLYGTLVLTVSIRADGSVEGVDISKSSGHRILDAAAVKIVEMAAPYASFPPDVRRDTDILHITRTWSFTKGEELVSQ